MKKAYLFILLISMSLPEMAQNQNNTTHSGFDVGYSYNGYVPVSLYLGASKTQFGLTVGIPAKTGTKGDYLPVINWSELPKAEDVIKQGEYYLPITFNLSQPIYNNLYLGAGIGYAFKTSYRNMYDETEKIGENGSYYIKSPDKGRIDYIMFLNYILPSTDSTNFSIRMFYSGLMSAGISIGYAF